jgi:hypothetical protein
LDRLGQLAPALAGKLHETCDRFEAAWRRGTRPQLADFLGPADDGLYAPLLAELVHLDVFYRRQRGEQPHADDYRARFPHLAPSVLASAFNATGPEHG